MTKFKLLDTSSLNELETRGFDLDASDPDKRVFLVKQDGELRCYRNSCPHTGAPLNWEGDRFLNSDQQFIQCALHGALFRPDNGLCIAGPCTGSSLTSIPITIEGDSVFVEL